MKDKKLKPELNALGQTFGEALESMKIPTGLEAIKISEIIDVSSWKEKQNKLVAENPFFKITDSKTYEAGKKHRTNVVKGRTELQNQEKLIASNFADIRKKVGSETSTLIEITKPLEDEWQAEVKAWEESKEREKQAEKEEEEKRIKTITDKIEAFETESYTIIQKMTFDNIPSDREKLNNLLEDDFDFEEYDILFDQTKDRIENAYLEKHTTLTANENQRLDNIRLETENAEAKRKSDLQANRLNEIMPYVAFGVAVDLTKLSELKDENYTEILKGKKELFDADVLAKQQIENDRLAKEEEEKDAVYEIRKKRLEEAGMIYSDEHSSFWTKLDLEYIILEHDIYNEGTLEFEDTLVEVKKVIEREQRKIEVRAEREKLFAEAGMPLGEGFELLNFGLGDGTCFTIDAKNIFDVSDEKFAANLELAKDAFFKFRSSFVTAFGYIHNPITKNFELEKFDSYSDDFLDYTSEFFNDKVEEIKLHVQQRNEELSKADAEKLKAENKARIKKYSGDKKALTEFVKSLEFRSAVPELQNEDMQPVLDKILLELENSRGFLLTEINIF